MNQQRYSKTQKHQQKKINKTKHDKISKAGFNEEEENLLTALESMNLRDLEKFMDAKFDKIVETNEKLFPKIYSAICKRMRTFLKEFKETERKRFARFVQKHTGHILSEEELKATFESAKFQKHRLAECNPIQCSYYGVSQKNQHITLMRAAKYEAKQQFPSVVEKFYVMGFENLQKVEIDIKRFRKQFAEKLSEISEDFQIIKKAIQVEK